MAPPLPPKPKIGPLVRRSLFVAALGAGCGPARQPVRIGPPPPPRIGAEIVEPQPEPDAAPVDASEPDESPPPVRIGAEPIEPPRIGPPPPPRIGPPVNPTSLIRGEVVDRDGEPVALASLRVELAGGTRIVSTDRDGRFALDGLAGGAHSVQITAAGYASVELTLDPGARDTISIVLWA